MAPYLSEPHYGIRVGVYGIGFDRVQEEDVIGHVLTELAAGRGGQIVTPNVDILRQVRRDQNSRAHVESANLVLADGKPLIWASRIAGDPLPGRVPGSDLIWSLSAALSEHGRSIYLLGGAPGTASRAEQVMRSRFPGLRVAGHLSPPFGFDARPDQLEEVCATVVAAQPDLVYVGLGFPKQERVIARLRPLLASSWFLGCGAAIGFVAGVHRRAPLWMQRSGLEWAHRLASEPTRLMRRYLLHDLPFALELLAVSARDRLRPVRALAATGPVQVGAEVSAFPRLPSAPTENRALPETRNDSRMPDALSPATPLARPAGPIPTQDSGSRLPIQTGEQV